MKNVIILLTLTLMPMISLGQDENSKTEDDKQKVQTGAAYNTTKAQREARLNNFPDSLYSSSTILVLTNYQDDVKKLDKKYNNVFDGTIKVIHTSEYNESNYPIEEYPFIITPEIDYNKKAAINSTIGRFIVTGVDRATGKKYVQNNSIQYGELFYVRTYLRMWNAKIKGKRIIFTY